MKAVNEWIRRCIRTYIWKQLKRFRTRISRLRELGVPKGKAYEWANTHKGYWRIAGSWVMTTTYTNERLVALGYDDISKRYEALYSTYRTAVYWSVRMVV